MFEALHAVVARCCCCCRPVAPVMCQQQLQQSQSAIGNVIASVTASSDCAMTTRDEQRQQHAQPTYRQHATDNRQRIADNGQCSAQGLRSSSGSQASRLRQIGKRKTNEKPCKHFLTPPATLTTRRHKQCYLPPPPPLLSSYHRSTAGGWMDKSLRIYWMQHG